MTSRNSRRARREAERRTRQRQQRFLWGGIAATIVVVAGAFLLLGGSGDQTGDLAADFELTSSNGDTVKLSDYRVQPVAVTFMHTW